MEFNKQKLAQAALGSVLLATGLCALDYVLSPPAPDNSIQETSTFTAPDIVEQEVDGLEVTNLNPTKYGEQETHIMSNGQLIFNENTLPLDSVKVVNEIKEKYNIEVVSPSFWDDKINKPWKTSELQSLLNFIQKLPPSYLNGRMPNYIYLVKPSGSNGSAGGEAMSDVYVTLYISDCEGGDAGLEEVVAHEFTHNYSGIYKEVQRNFNNKIGWSFEIYPEIWINNDPESIGYTNYSLAKYDPTEDLAETVGMALTNPEKLDSKRISFLLNEPAFDGWEALKQFENNP